jgi:hypothetical protein
MVAEDISFWSLAGMHWQNVAIWVTEYNSEGASFYSWQTNQIEFKSLVKKVGSDSLGKESEAGSNWSVNVDTSTEIPGLPLLIDSHIITWFPWLW